MGPIQQDYWTILWYLWKCESFWAKDTHVLKTQIGLTEVNAAVLCFLRCEECLFRRTVPRESKEVGHLTDRVILSPGGISGPKMQTSEPHLQKISDKTFLHGFPAFGEGMQTICLKHPLVQDSWNSSIWNLLRIIDLWGVGLGHIGFAKDFLAVAVKQAVVLYPETLDRVLVVNADACSQLCPLFLLYFSCFSLEPELGVYHQCWTQLFQLDRFANSTWRDLAFETARVYERIF